MTWSVVALDATSRKLGIAVSSKFFAVGAVCPYLSARVGAVSTQSFVNPYLGVQSIALMVAGSSAPAALESVLAADVGRATRQLHGVDMAGRTAAHTGSDCVEWAGHQQAENVSVAGNMLAGPAVVKDTLEAFLDHRDKPFAERLLRAMTAGEHAGGDKRGRQAAALKVVGEEDYTLLDLRVDDHTNPIAELWRLYQVAHERSLARTSLMPTRARPLEECGFAGMDSAMEARLANQSFPDFSAEIAALQLLSHGPQS